MSQPLKVLTAAKMNEIDRRTIESGISGLILMENAAHRVVEVLAEKFAPLQDRRIAVLCGRGNNGGDGLAIARQLWVRFQPKQLTVVLTADPGSLAGDAAVNWKMLEACGCPLGNAAKSREIPSEARFADLVIDAILGTGITGPARGPALDGIRAINTQFPLAKVVAVDLPSGLASDTGKIPGEFVRADYTVTFTAPKPAHSLAPACEHMGELHIGAIGTPPSMFQDDPALQLSLITPEYLEPLFAPRSKESNKGIYGHVLVVAGSRGKTGAAAMTGVAGLRAGAGLVTVASAHSAVPVIASHAPELMTEPLPETESGGIAGNAFEQILALAENKNVIAIGPGLGKDPETVELVRRLYGASPKTMVIDADALNAMAGADWKVSGSRRVLTPHPGEMSRLTGKATREIQDDRVGTARSFATDVGVHLVLKGNRTLMAHPNGDVWINPTGSPGMATGGTGDILTGLIAGFLAQFEDRPEQAIAAAVYLHGLAGERGARATGEKALIATDLLRHLKWR